MSTKAKAKTQVKKSSKRSVIKLRNVSKDFVAGNRGISVLTDVNLDIYDGEFVMIFGPSGCGKTTLLNIISGLEKPSKGDVSTFGFNLWEMSEDDRAMTRKKIMGIIYQSQNWIKSLNVEENVGFVLELQGMDREDAIIEAKANLKDADILKRSTYSPMELSSGEQQKVSLARALITDPKLLIADEPTGNLDIRSGHELMEDLKDLHQSGTTIIMVTHNPEYLQYASRIIFMLDGKVHDEKEIGTKAQAEKAQEEFTEYLGTLTNGVDHTYEYTKSAKPPREKAEKSLASSLGGGLISAFRTVLTFWLHALGLSTIFLISQFARLRPAASKNIEKVRASLLKWSTKLMPKADTVTKSINGLNISELSYRNLFVKRSRTLITIMGIGLGMGFIVFLMSIGFGLENLVISAIAKAEDIRQVDVIPSPASNIILDDQSILDMSEIEHIEAIQPIISLAAKVDYQGSQIDTVSYGVSKEYIDSSTFTIRYGEVTETYDEENQIAVSEDFLLTLGISPGDAVGKTLMLSLTSTDVMMEAIVEEIDVMEEVVDAADEIDEETEEVVESTIEDSAMYESGRFETESQEYEIVAVITESDASVIYVPLQGIVDQGARSYSQARIVLSTDAYAPQVRHTLEIEGYSTLSITDRIAEVEKLFATFRISLILVGAVALSVAILGMVNTLTVSLLERTREIGFLKVIGMRSGEIRLLFITEAMLMGLLGSLSGLIFGYLGGKLLSLVLTVMSFSNGGGWIDVTSYPASMILGLLLLGTAVGYLTGMYPANRAVKMSPLDALRYE